MISITVVNVERSQSSGENFFRALGYQKKFIGYLSMYFEKYSIKKIICENNGFDASVWIV
jgi:hypothetical protein